VAGELAPAEQVKEPGLAARSSLSAGPSRPSRGRLGPRLGTASQL